jgi:hypothetical protein
MDMHAMYRPKFDPFARGFVDVQLGRLGQLGQSSIPALADLERRTAEAIAKYQALMRRVSAISDDKTRNEILGWIDGDVPGSPSDRFRHVKDESDQDAPWDEVRTGHLDDLESVNQEFETRVLNGEKAGVTRGSGPLQMTDDQGRLTGIGVGLVVIAGAALFVVTLAFK